MVQPHRDHVGLLSLHRSCRCQRVAGASV